MARFPLSSMLESIDPSRRIRTPQADARRDGPSTTEIAGASPEETCLFGEPRRGIRRRPWPIANEYRARPRSGGCSATMVFNLDCGSLRIDARRSINDGVRDQFAMGAGKRRVPPRSLSENWWAKCRWFRSNMFGTRRARAVQLRMTRSVRAAIRRCDNRWRRAWIVLATVAVDGHGLPPRRRLHLQARHGSPSMASPAGRKNAACGIDNGSSQ